MIHPGSSNRIFLKRLTATAFDSKVSTFHLPSTAASWLSFHRCPHDHYRSLICHCDPSAPLIWQLHSFHLGPNDWMLTSRQRQRKTLEQFKLLSEQHKGHLLGYSATPLKIKSKLLSGGGAQKWKTFYCLQLLPTPASLPTALPGVVSCALKQRWK